MRELFFEDGLQFQPEDGQKIIPAQDLQVTRQKEDLLKLVCIGEDGRQEQLLIGLRSGKGVDWYEAEKSAAAIKQYYQADWNCEVMYERIYQHLQKGGEPEQLSLLGVQVEQQGALYYVTYTEDINDEEKLLVKLAVQPEGGLKTEQWKVIAAKQWNYDERIDVWNGE